MGRSRRVSDRASTKDMLFKVTEYKKRHSTALASISLLRLLLHGLRN